MEIICLVNMGKTFFTWHHALTIEVEAEFKTKTAEQAIQLGADNFVFMTSLIFKLLLNTCTVLNLLVDLLFRVYDIFIYHSCTDNKIMASIEYGLTCLLSDARCIAIIRLV